MLFLLGLCFVFNGNQTILGEGTELEVGTASLRLQSPAGLIIITLKVMEGVVLRREGDDRSPFLGTDPSLGTDSSFLALA